MVAFRCYDASADGSGGIHLWYHAQIPEVRSAIDGTLENMGRETVLDERPDFKPLRGKCAGLAEIKIELAIKRYKKIEKIHIRLLGPHDPPTTEFVLLSGFLKKGDPEYGPMCKQAHNRHRGVQRDARRTKPCLFPAAPSSSGKHA
jgi:hypothetical protein